jgi:hypothetical protein
MNPLSKAEMAILVEVWRLSWLGDQTLRARELRVAGAYEPFFNREMAYAFASQQKMANAVHMNLRTFKRALAGIRGRYVTNSGQGTTINRTILCMPPEAEVRTRHQVTQHLPLAKDKKRRETQQKARETAIQLLLAACPNVSLRRDSMVSPRRDTQGVPSNTSDSTSDSTSVLTGPIGKGWARKRGKKRRTGHL